MIELAEQSHSEHTFTLLIKLQLLLSGLQD